MYGESLALKAYLTAGRVKRLRNVVIVVLLVIAVPALGTIAKVNLYLPYTNPGHYLNIANKTKVSCSPVVFEHRLFQWVAQVVPLQTQARLPRRLEAEVEVPWIDLTISLQHRSPPFASV